MKVIIVRHAQTDENAADRLAAAKSDILLNEEGIRQAEKLGHHLKGHRISHAYVSPLKRAVHTADHILAHHADATTVHVEDLREQDKQGGESRVELQSRIKKFFHKLIAKHGPNDTILIVSHGGPLGVLLLDILEKELIEENYRAHQPKNTEFSIVEIDENGKKKIHELNSNTHLN